MSAAVEHARRFLELGHIDRAETEARRALSENPGEWMAHIVLAMCLAAKKRPDAALEAARAGLAAAPDEWYAHYAHAWVLEQNQKHAEAIEAIERAVSLAPELADPRFFLSQLLYGIDRRKEAREVLDAGLELEPDSPWGQRLRAHYLNDQGKTAEAQEAIGEALAASPDDSAAHRTRGLLHLRRGERDQAIEALAEALRINPHDDMARQLMIEAIKARFVLYRWLLGFFLWMGTLSNKAALIAMIGPVVLRRVLSGISQKYPAAAFYLEPIIWASVGFALLTWIAQPLSNFVLLTHRLGRLLLSPDEKRAAGLVGSLTVAAHIFVALWIFGDRDLWLPSIIGAGSAAVILGAYYGVPIERRGWHTWIVAPVVAIALLGIGLSIASSLTRGLGFIACAGSFLAMIIYTWIVSIRAIRSR